MRLGTLPPRSLLGVVRLYRHACVSWCVRRLLPGRSCTDRNNYDNQTRRRVTIGSSRSQKIKRKQGSRSDRLLEAESDYKRIQLFASISKSPPRESRPRFCSLSLTRKAVVPRVIQIYFEYPPADPRQKKMREAE